MLASQSVQNLKCLIEHAGDVLLPMLFLTFEETLFLLNSRFSKAFATTDESSRFKAKG